MPMPKGHKLENGYSTSKSLGGDSYQEISDKMSDQGFKMNHSTARNVFVNSLKILILSILKSDLKNVILLKHLL